VWRSRGQGLLAPSSGDAEGALWPALVRRRTVVGALVAVASMGSGRGDRNQFKAATIGGCRFYGLQWGPVVVTGIRLTYFPTYCRLSLLQWGPVVVTGIRVVAACARAVPASLQWGPVVVTGISSWRPTHRPAPGCFNGVRSW